MVPPLLMAITRLGLAEPDGFRTCVGHLWCAAAPLGPEQQREASEKLGIPVGQLWGLSETTGAATGTSHLEAVKPGSAGRVLRGVEVKVIDEEGQSVPHGERGEVCGMDGPWLGTSFLTSSVASGAWCGEDVGILQQ